jgi:hypothetical protein
VAIDSGRDAIEGIEAETMRNGAERA